MRLFGAEAPWVSSSMWHLENYTENETKRRLELMYFLRNAQIANYSSLFPSEPHTVIQDIRSRRHDPFLLSNPPLLAPLLRDGQLGRGVRTEFGSGKIVASSCAGTGSH
jgi:hypothetical protein